MFTVLLRYRLKSLWNGIRLSTPRQRFAGAGLAILSLFVAAGIFGGFLIVTFFRRHGESGVALSYEVALSVFLFMLAGSVPFLAATLLHPGDVDLLGAAPVVVRHAVAMRLLEGAAAGALQFMPIGAPAVAACAVGLGASPASLVLLLIPGVLIVLLPSCLTATLLLLAVLHLGYSRVRAATATVNVLLGAVVCVVVVAQVTGLRLQEGLTGLVSGSTNPSGKVAFLPPWAWFGQSLNALAHGDYRSFWSATAICTAVTVALGWIAVVLGERVWVAGSLAEGSGAVRYRYREPSRRRGFLASLIPAPLAAVLCKEFRYLWRDPLLVSQAGMPMILFVVPFIMAGNPAMGRAVGQDEMFAFSIFMVLAVLYMQASILSASSIGLEGRAFWAYLISPNNAQTLLLGKWLASWLISGGLACALIIIAGLAFQAQMTDVVVLCAAAAGSAAGLCGIGVGISSALPRFTFENPAHRVSPLALIFGFGAGIFYSAVGWSTLGATWYATVTWPRYGLIASCVGVSAFAILTVFAVMVPLGIGIERISNLEWEH